MLDLLVEEKILLFKILMSEAHERQCSIYWSPVDSMFEFTCSRAKQAPTCTSNPNLEVSDQQCLMHNCYFSNVMIK